MARLLFAMGSIIREEHADIMHHLPFMGDMESTHAWVGIWQTGWSTNIAAADDGVYDLKKALFVFA